ncbi:RusA family crossover junction endodeoxyribonuclease [Anaerobutyricum hallii]|uniref:RusA family crossover junction endodeoxyribonuclease n=1 Tax=Anaerobutyricum hallii TaxID=39488 RepID=UPI00399FAF3B
MVVKLMIPGKLDNLNDYITACRTNQYKGAKVKHKNENRVIQAIYEQLGRLRIKKPVYMTYAWYEPNKRRDLDNVSSFGRKVIQDALVETRVLENDGWKNIVGFQDNFYIDADNPRVEVVIREV